MTDRDLPTRTEGETLDMPEGMGAFSKGRILGERYQILEMLGRGGMGEVWKAFDLKLRVEVALKALRPEFFKSERRLELLRQEVRAAREVMSPNVCRIFDLIEVEGRELVSMEYVDGATLLGVLQERAPLELKEAQDIASQFLAGLEAIHKVGLVHRDIKPENIMLTRAGRVVVMDFGLARQEAEGGGSVSGTPAYMAPEQAAGQTLDARADVYAAGVVLAEMVSPEGITSYESRQSVWEGVRSEPAKVPDSPWAAVIKKAVAKDREGRFNSAHTLTRALEDVTLRVEGAEDLDPYPGLASFTEEDAEYFFGREAEIETVWRRLANAHLLAIVGPSGAGKSSFIAAGIVPNAPTGWAIVRFTPGNAAISSLARAMAREMAGDADAVEMAVGLDDPAIAAELFSRWRKRHDQTLLIVDQFEELFTQNSQEEQVAFSELLGRLPVESDVRVLLSMRDDFLMSCNRHEALKPVFSDLTPLDPPTGSALRRALTQPAMKCGYRFEDDALVEEMLSEVEGERGALPSLAFAAAQLWERRDRETGLLTREAYQEIGGVGGALAQHAEATIDRIGSEKLPIVRELFRNLVTAEGTRAVREWNDLLSVFSDSRSESQPEEVLRHLIDARLLTSYEMQEGDEAPTRRVEIIHESLLATWPRLVRWQTQDQEGAQLRDELRQAARVWDEHGRHDDRLWTGTAFREYQLWCERYPGRLTAVEEAFAKAMTSLSTRRRRRRRLAVAAGFAVLLAVLTTVTVLWRTSVRQTRRAEARQLLSNAREWFDKTGRSAQALARSVASLELEDSRSARELALQHATRAPLPFIASDAGALSVGFSPDGRWLAASAERGTVLLWPSEGGEPSNWQAYEVSSGESFPFVVKFTPDSRAVMTYRWGQPAVKFWSVPDGRLVNTVDKEPDRIGSRLAAFTTVNMLRIVRGDDGEWALDRRGAERLREIDPSNNLPADLSPDGAVLAYGDGAELLVERLDSERKGAPRLVGTGGEPIRHLDFGPDGRRVATVDGDGTVLVWSLEGDEAAQTPLRRNLGKRGGSGDQLLFDPTGSLLAFVGDENILVLDLLGPPDAEPVLLRGVAMHAAFHPDGRWLAASSDPVSVWPIDRSRLNLVLRGHSAHSSCAFAPDGRWMVSASLDHTVRWWPLEPSAGRASRLLPTGPLHWSLPEPSVALNAARIALAWGGDAVRLVPVDGGPPIELQVPGETLNKIAIDPEGRYVAAASIGGTTIHGWDLESGESLSLDAGDGIGIANMRMVAGARLLVRHNEGEGTSHGLISWNLKSGEHERLFDGSGVWWAGCRGAEPSSTVSDDGRFVLGVQARSQTSEQRPVYLADLTDRILLELDAFTAWADLHMGLDASGSTVVAWSQGRHFEIGRVTAEHPHIVPWPIGPEQTLGFPSISPRLDRIAVGYGDGSIWLHPVPDLDSPPLNFSSPLDEFISRLETFTNLRAVRDPESETGWKFETDPFPGWEKEPEW